MPTRKENGFLRYPSDQGMGRSKKQKGYIPKAMGEFPPSSTFHSCADSVGAGLNASIPDAFFLFGRRIVKLAMGNKTIKNEGFLLVRPVDPLFYR